MLGPLSQTSLPRHDDRRSAALDAQLIEDAGDVVAHGFLGQFEPRGDLRVVEALRDQLEHPVLWCPVSAETRLPANDGE